MFGFDCLDGTCSLTKSPILVYRDQAGLHCIEERDLKFSILTHLDLVLGHRPNLLFPLLFCI
jgi:hypothetical protein